MYKKIIEVPLTYCGNTVKHLSDYPILDDLLDRGKVILDKVIPGCGATEYYLRLPNRPVILTAPLNLLLESKMDMNPTDEELLSGLFDHGMKRSNQVHYFDRSNESVNVDKSRELLYGYLQNKLQIPGFAPKIMVSYDSFGTVCDMLEYMGCLDQFTIVVDEFPAIFQYVGLPKKGTVFMNLLERLNALNNQVVFLTATPVEYKYLEPISGFKGIPYYQLKWNEDMIQKVRILSLPIRSVKEKVLEIVNTYRTEGHFRCTLDANKNIVRSTEGIFFLNSVEEICRVINYCRLASNEVLILCSRNSKNEERLKKIDPTLGRFSIGKPANQWNYATMNKPFTFITSVAFLGVDMHSDCSSSYVFANGNVASLSLDISIDLPQIAGRCRTEQPFKDDITMFYVESAQKVIDKAKKDIEKRVDRTNEMLPSYSGIDSMVALRPIMDAQKYLCYKDYYLDVKELGNGKGQVVINETAHQAHLRAIDIKEQQLKSGYTISRFVDKTAQLSISGQLYNVVYEFFTQYRSMNDFVSRMKLYVDTLESYPQIKSYIEQNLTNVDIEYKQYYIILGPDEIRRCQYRKADIQRRINEIDKVQNNSSLIVARCYELMPKGSRVSKKEVKDNLGQIYSEFGLSSIAKSTDFQNWGIPVRETKVNRNGKREAGYEIL